MDEMNEQPISGTVTGGTMTVVAHTEYSVSFDARTEYEAVSKELAQLEAERRAMPNRKGRRFLEALERKARRRRA